MKLFSRKKWELIRDDFQAEKDFDGAYWNVEIRIDGEYVGEMSVSLFEALFGVDYAGEDDITIEQVQADASDLSAQINVWFSAMKETT